MRLSAIPLLMGALVCAVIPLAARQSGESESSERWGGRNISMQMTVEGASLEFDCGRGAILQPIKPNAAGDFSVAGTYTQEMGGPVLKNNPPRDLPATYKGRISGDTMHLEIVLSDKDLQLPAFTLTRGSAGRLVKCR